MFNEITKILAITSRDIVEIKKNRACSKDGKCIILKIRAVAGQRSSPDLCFATTSVKIIDLKVTQVGHHGTT